MILQVVGAILWISMLVWALLGLSDFLRSMTSPGKQIRPKRQSPGATGSTAAYFIGKDRPYGHKTG